MISEDVLDTYNCVIPYEDMRVSINRFVYTVTDGGFFAPVHMHNDYEFHYVVSGKALVSVEDTEFQVGAGDMYITNPFINHSEYSIESDPMVLFAFECQLDFPDSPKNKSDEFEVNAIKDILQNIYYQPFSCSGDIFEMLDIVKDINKSKPFGYRLRSKILLMGCIAKTMQLIADNHKLVAPKMRNYTSEKRITSIRNYIDVNITNNVCAEDVCKQVFLSERQLNRIFLDKCGKTVNQYIFDAKFEIAKNLLLTTDESLENIAAKSGFINYQQLYRAFTRKLHVTPGEFRGGKNDGG